MPSTDTYKLLLAAAAACEDKKAEDIRILALDPTESGLTDYFLICNGTNDRQNVAITDEIEIRLKREFGVYPNSVEGRRQGEWVLMDYVDFIVHVFSAEKRAHYGLERLRKSATTISLAELSAELKALIASTRTRTAKASGADSKPAPKADEATGEEPAKPGAKAAGKKVAKKTAKAAKPADESEPEDDATSPEPASPKLAKPAKKAAKLALRPAKAAGPAAAENKGAEAKPGKRKSAVKADSSVSAQPAVKAKAAAKSRAASAPTGKPAKA